MKRILRRTWPILLILSILAGPPLAMLAYQSHRTGMTWSQILRRMVSRAGGRRTGLEDVETPMLPEGEKIDFLEPLPIVNPQAEPRLNRRADPPRISHLQVVDLDQDGLLDVVVCDAQSHRVTWIRQHPRGVYTEQTCADGLVAPAHVQAVDFDDDGDLDLMVAVLGMLFPNNDRIGSVVILENVGEMKFTKHVVVERAVMGG